jgi:glycosyltransferase involved in cell wall biosynthesis
MKIIQISTNTLRVPPKDYGGTQRDVYYLTEELIRRGHEVILFAKKGSSTSAKTYTYRSKSKKKQLDFIIKRIPKDADIIHDHYGIVANANPPIPTIRNSHTRSVNSTQIPVFVSKTILRSNGKRKGYYVHNGIRLKDYRFCKEKDDYLLFLGRIIPEKGVHHAIQVAKRTGKRLIIAGPVQNDKGRAYFNKKIKPHLNDKITYIGAVGGEQKQELISKAYCVLFPSLWKEPFGLVLIESLACGTPVLGFKRGAVPEVLKGFPQLVCKGPKEMARKVKSGKVFPSASKCRSYIRKNFSDKVMASDFLKLYRKVLKGKKYRVMRNSLWNRRKKQLAK